MGENWKQLGLKAGLEIHQQLGREGDRKLFCQCPAEIVEREPDMTITRSLRAAAGETGAIDVAAAAEQAKQKAFTYHAFDDTTCLVEIDEEPPHPVNQEVVKTTIMVAKSLGSTILPRVQIMRKTIVDGSNVSGFQRTGLVAIGGKIPGTDVRIQTVAIEEDAAKIVSRSADEDIYNLSRLGIPLMEIATEPDIRTPEEAKETAAQLGMILRSTKRVKRGLGTIRQDVNVSIEGGARIEIKGAQDLRMIPSLVENEARRQHGLLLLKEKGLEVEISEPVDVTDIFKKSEVGFIKNALGKGARATGIRITNFRGVLGTDLCPGYRVGTELAGLAKSQGFGGIIHSDEKLGKYGVGDKEMELRRQFSCDEKDAFLVLVGAATEPVLRGVIAPRIEAFNEGVPNEVRKANDDGTTTYLRPMPGGARMYPETDIPIVEIDTEGIEAPVLLTDQIAEISQKTGLSKDISTEIVQRDIPIMAYHSQFPSLDFNFLANALISWPKAQGVENPELYLEEIFPLLESGEVPKTAVKPLFARIAKGAPDPKEVRDLLAGMDEQLSEEDIRGIVEAVVAKNPGLSQGAYMGDVMKEARGKADGKIVMKILTEVLK